MRRLRWLVCCFAIAFAVAPFAGCRVADRAPTQAAAAASRGRLLLVGGGLDDDARPVYERLLALAAGASADGVPRIAIVTAATGPQDEEATDKAEALHTWSPHAAVEIVRRETPTDATIQAIDRAGALLFTGGDQARITARYRPEDADTPEWLAMQRLLARGGVIAGCSAGCAMMGRQMIAGGRSAQALGIPPKPAAGDDEPAPLGARLLPGMKFLPWGLTDSHFFERDRTGRLAVSLLAAGERFGLAVGEDAAVEVDLATGEVTGVTPAETLLVDAAYARADERGVSGLRARVLGQGDRASLHAPLPPRVVGLPVELPTVALTTPAALAAAAPAVTGCLVPIVEPGQNRQLAMWRLFRQAAVPGAGVHTLALDCWRVRAVAADAGWVVFAVERT